MKKYLLIVSLLMLMAANAEAGKYVFFGRGSAKTDKRECYHNGVSGVYIGYHPGGITNSRTAGKTDSHRQGVSISIPRGSVRYSGVRGEVTMFKTDFSLPVYGERNGNSGGEVTSSRTTTSSEIAPYTPMRRIKIYDFKNSLSLGTGKTITAGSGSSVTNSLSASGTSVPVTPMIINPVKSYNPLKKGSVEVNSLGFSSSVTDIDKTKGGYGGGGSSSIILGRSNGGSNSREGAGSSSVVGGVPGQKSSGRDLDKAFDEGEEEVTQGFMEPVNYDSVPIGDAIIPLLLLVIPVVIIKLHKR